MLDNMHLIVSAVNESFDRKRVPTATTAGMGTGTATAAAAMTTATPPRL